MTSCSSGGKIHRVVEPPLKKCRDVGRNVDVVPDEMRKYEGHVGNDKKEERNGGRKGRGADERCAEEDLGQQTSTPIGIEPVTFQGDITCRNHKRGCTAVHLPGPVSHI